MTALPTPNVRRPRSSRRIVLDLLAAKTISDLEIVDAVSHAFDVTALEPLFKSGLTVDEIASLLGISDRTIRRYLKNGGHLSLVESDRLVRVARILGIADASIGSHAKALGWLRSQVWSLGNRVPLQLIAVENGAQMVRQALGAIAYGGVA